MLIERIVTDLLERIEVLGALPLEQKERLGNLISRRLWMIQHKLRMSPYDPKREPDGAINLNTDFAGAIRKWALQFSPEYQAGALALGLSIHYVTEDEADNFLEDCVVQFKKEKIERVKKSIRPRRVVPYPSTDRTDIFGKFVHQAKEHGTADVDVKMLGPLENLVFVAAHTTWLAAEGRLASSGCYDLAYILELLLDKHHVIVRDLSMSGHSLSEDLREFLFLLRVLFGKREIQRQLEETHHALPIITVVLPFATGIAMKSVTDVLADTDIGFNVEPRIITGFIYEGNDRLIEGCTPEGLRMFQHCVPSVNWRTLSEKACTEYAQRSSLAQVKQGSDEGWARDDLDDETLKFGYGIGGGRGWTIVGSNNCPDNSLPLYWRPYSSDDRDSFEPLFPRVVANVFNKRTRPRLREWLSVSEKDADGNLRNAMRSAVGR